MESILLLVAREVALTEVADFLAERSVSVEARSAPGDDHLLCRFDNKPSWEVSLETQNSPLFHELEDDDLHCIDRLGARSVILIAHRTTVFPDIHRILRDVDWGGPAWYLKGDGSGISFNLGATSLSLSSLDELKEG
jgi:hypothetical protein